jgi:hypothetical protein
MSHFAKVVNNVVKQVIVAEQDVINSGLFGDPGQWIQTSYNGTIRKNFANIGFAYDAVRDAFIPLKPYPSWILNETTCRWQAPIPSPDDGQMYGWNEPNQSWDVV